MSNRAATDATELLAVVVEAPEVPLAASVIQSGQRVSGSTGRTTSPDVGVSGQSAVDTDLAEVL